MLYEVITDASSACEIIYDIFQYFGKELSFKTAQALYAGIVFDTGSFKYPKTTSETFSIAAHLLEFVITSYSIHYTKLYEEASSPIMEKAL